MGSDYALYVLDITDQKFVFFAEKTENMICVYEKSGGANVRDSFVGLIRERIFGSYFQMGTEYKLHRFDDQGYAVGYFE